MHSVLILMACPVCGRKNRMILSAKHTSPPSCGSCHASLFELYAVIEGCVYLLSNPAMPRLLKIGQTRGNLAARVAQLSSATGVPKPFRVEAYFLSAHPQREEAALHAKLAKSRAAGREFFSLGRDEAVRACEEVLGRKAHFDRMKHGDFRE